MKPVPEFRFKGEPFSVENSKQFIRLLLAKNNEIPMAESEVAEDPIGQMFLKRIDHYKLKFTVTDFFFAFSAISFIDRPGKIMIFLRLCFQYWRDTGKKLIGIEDFAMIFPNGTPTDDELRTMWKSQKYFDRPSNSFSDNILDYPESWSSDAEEKSESHSLRKKKRKVNWEED